VQNRNTDVNLAFGQSPKRHGRYQKRRLFLTRGYIKISDHNAQSAACMTTPFFVAAAPAPAPSIDPAPYKERARA